MECFIFHGRVQKEGEDFESFLVDMRWLSQTCKFCDDRKDSTIRDKTVLGIHDDDTRKSLLRECNLFLAKCINIVRQPNLFRHTVGPCSLIWLLVWMVGVTSDTRKMRWESVNFVALRSVAAQPMGRPALIVEVRTTLLSNVITNLIGEKSRGQPPCKTNEKKHLKPSKGHVHQLADIPSNASDDEWISCLWLLWRHQYRAPQENN